MGNQSSRYVTQTAKVTEHTSNCLPGLTLLALWHPSMGWNPKVPFCVWKMFFVCMKGLFYSSHASRRMQMIIEPTLLSSHTNNSAIACTSELVALFLFLLTVHWIPPLIFICFKKTESSCVTSTMNWTLLTAICDLHFLFLPPSPQVAVLSNLGTGTVIAWR